MKRIYRWGCGRTSTFALFLLAAGIALAATHRLDASFVGLATIIQALITFRAVSDDHREHRENWHAGKPAPPAGGTVA